MADEITFSSRLSVVNSAASINDQIIIPATNADMAGMEREDTFVSVGFAAEEALPLGDVGTIGWCFFQNLDATNFVTLYMATGHTVGLKFLPGEGYHFRLNATAPFAKADTAACRCRWVVYEA